MQVLHVGMHQRAQRALKERGVILSTPEKFERISDAVDWLKDGLFDALVINLSSLNWDCRFPRHVRSFGVHTPIVGIVWSRESWSHDRALFLESGGDDLLRHPEQPRELLASLRAVIRRNKGRASDTVVMMQGSTCVTCDRTAREICINGFAVKFTSTEFLILEAMILAPKKAFSREELLCVAYPHEKEVIDTCIDHHMKRIRRKIKGVLPDVPDIVEAVYGFGYRTV